ncbi:Ig-like domain repeat protein [Streptomyces sp. PKU-EA00015]|uniref:Ig-like domain repeat protein n=1 Tax=Streptomyces sp. PKU-EA00015 TaxID=2748326 RepID=UPI00210971F6|nr:Ig-like domain repeat protein [Streptomyces sp. PKU-EA00015]
MSTFQYTGRRLAAMVAATVISGGGLVVAAPAAHAAEASDVVAKLPISSFSDMVVDSVHERVFVSDRAGYAHYGGTVVAYNFQGQKVGTFYTTSRASGLALSEDAGTLYVGQRSHVVAYDTQTLQETGHTGAYTDDCGRELAVTGTKSWHTTTPAYSDYHCDKNQTDLDSMTDGLHARTGWNAAGKILLATGGGAPNRLFMGQAKGPNATDPFLTSFDTSGPTPVRGDSRRFADAEGKGGLDPKDLAVSADGKHLAVADAAYGTRLLNSGDLTDAGVYQPLPTGATSSAVAFSGDGKYVARGASAAGSTPDLLIQPADPANGTTATEFAYEGDLDGNRVVNRGLEWSKDGSRLFALTTNAYGNAFWLHVIQPPAAQYDSRFSGALTHTPAQAVVGEPVGIRGRLELDGPAPAEPAKVTAVRTTADGTRTLAAAEVAADGTFTVLDVPDAVGSATYTLSFLGDITHRPAEDVSITVDVAKAPMSIALTAPQEASMSGGVEITGKLTAQGRALPAGVTLAVRRTDRLGTGSLSSVPVAADGTFTVNDMPRARRDVTYTVSYEGDDLHTGSSASATVYVTR